MTDNPLLADYSIRTAIGVNNDLIETGVFHLPEMRGPLFRAAVTQFLIHLRDLLIQSRRTGCEVASPPAFLPTDRIPTITDLIVRCRNVVCHIGSPLRMVERGVTGFIVIPGGQSIRIGGATLTCDYPDDFALYFGPVRLYLYRHAIYAFEEAKIMLAERT